MRGKKKHTHSFVLLFRWTTEYDQDPVNPYLRQRFLPIDQALAKRANLPEEQLWHVSFFAARLNFDLLSSPPRIYVWLHFGFPHKLNFLQKLWRVCYLDLNKAQRRGRHERFYRSRTTEEPERPPRTQGEILIDTFVWAAFIWGRISALVHCQRLTYRTIKRTLLIVLGYILYRSLSLFPSVTLTQTLNSASASSPWERMSEDLPHTLPQALYERI